jgi:hypothetical protein
LILVLSNLANEAAGELVRMFPTGTASLVTASDFNQSVKASISVGDFSPSEITLGGIRTTAGRISGVVSTIPYFLPQEFYYIDPADREYVCAELSAFLIYFLSELACKKLNPPSARRLSGLGLHRVEWLKAASGCGVPIWPVRTKNGTPLPVGDSEGLQQTRSTIVGDAVVGEGVPDKIIGYLRALSLTFAMPYVSCHFVSRNGNDYFLADLDFVPDVSTRENREAMIRFLN